MELKAMDSNDPADTHLQSDFSAIDDGYRWLAHELHDGLLQWVVAARMQVEVGLSKCEEHSAAIPNFLRALSHLEQSQAEGRALIGYLDAQASGDVELVPALSKYLQSIAPDATERGQSLHFRPAQPPWPTLPKQLAWSILRLLQQATQNAIQHAGPAEIEIALGWHQVSTATQQPEGISSPPTLVAYVVDNGKGFDTEQPAEHGHFGLQSIQQRAKMCNASLSIESKPNDGTRITVVIPL